MNLLNYPIGSDMVNSMNDTIQSNHPGNGTSTTTSTIDQIILPRPVDVRSFS